MRDRDRDRGQRYRTDIQRQTNREKETETERGRIRTENAIKFQNDNMRNGRPDDTITSVVDWVLKMKSP